jgi:two-component system nitrate/nitrite response regulator NarP
MTRVLLADDHPFMRTGVEAVLRGTAYELVAAAANGQAALEAIAEFDPAICILDVRMPELTGLEVLERLRSAGDRRPVVLLTADLEDSDLLAAVRRGVNGIVLKDGAEDELVACLDTVTAGGRAIPPDLLQRALDLSLTGAGDSLSALAPREREIAALVGKGMRNRDIAAALGMTEGTVKMYLHTIYQKLGIENRTELALLAHGRPRSGAPNVR